MVKVVLAVALTAALTLAAAVAVPVRTPPTPDGPVPYTTVTDGQAAAWPCTPPVTWALNPTAAPAGAAEAFAAALQPYAAATGLTFTYLGPTAATASESPDPDRPDRPADLLISYSGANPETAAALLEGAPDTAAATVTTTRYQPAMGVVRRASNHIIAADIVIRSDLDPGAAGAVALHEIGHALGLDHPPDATYSIMTGHVDPAMAAPSTADKATLADLYGPCPPS